MRRFIAMAAIVLAALVVPTIGTAGAGQSVESWTNNPESLYGPDPCTGKTVVGTGTSSGTALITQTPNNGFHTRIEIQGTFALYEANGPPWDPQPGAFVGTWTYETTISDETQPGQVGGSTTAVASGPIVFADGSTARRQSVYHATWGAWNGEWPPRLFFVQFVCPGA